MSIIKKRPIAKTLESISQCNRDLRDCEKRIKALINRSTLFGKTKETKS